MKIKLTTDKTDLEKKIKKEIKGINREIKKLLSAMVDAGKRGHSKQFNYYSDKLRQLRAERDRLQSILNK